MQEGQSREALRIWLALVGSATLVLGASYATVQQSARLSANDAPLSTARAAKEKLEDGKTPKEVIPTEETDLRSDSGIFLIVTDESEKILASSAVLDDEAALPTPGVFDLAGQKGSDSFTWEPKNGVRHATQVLKYDSEDGSGFVVAGQSLARIEERTSTYNLIAILAWLAVVAWATIILFPAPQSIARRRKMKITK